MRILIILSLSVLIACGQNENESNQSSSANWVNDNIELLSSEENSMLTSKLQMLSDSIGSQMVILIIDSLGGEKIEAYGLRTAESLRIGRADYNDGVLLLIAIYDRQVRIEVGYGLENILRDEISASIIRETIAPTFQNENYYAGISLAVEEISQLIYSNKELIGSKPTW